MTKGTRIIINTIASYMRSLYALFLGLFSARWVLSALGKDDFGLFGIVGSLIVFVQLLNNILSSAVSRYYAFEIGKQTSINKSDSENSFVVNDWFNAAVFIHTVIPLLLVAVGYPIGLYAIRNWLVIPDEREMACIWVFRFSIIACFFNMISVPYIAMYRARQLIVELSFWSIISSTVTFIFAFILLSWDGDRLVAYATYMTGVSCIVVCIQMIRARLKFPDCVLVPQRLVNFKCLKKLFSFALGELFGSLGGTIRDNGMPFLINANFSLAMNASYTISNQLSAHTSSLSSAMIGALVPAVTTAEGAGNHEEASKLSFRCIKFGVLLIGLFAIPLFNEIEQVLNLWLKDPPVAAGLLCKCMLVAMMIHKLGWGHHVAILATGRVVVYQMVVGSLGAGGLLIAYSFLKSGLGALGIGLSFIVTYMLMSCARAIFARSICHMSIRYWLSRVVIPLAIVILISVGIGLLCKHMFQPSACRILITALASVASLLFASWFFVFDDEERIFILNTISRIINTNKA